MAAAPATSSIVARAALSRGPRSQHMLRAGERWYVVQTLPHRECGAQRQLEAQGFRSFMPCVVKTVRHARKMRTVRAPVFLGYLFVILDLQRDRWRAVNGTIGVARMVMGDERPTPVPHGVVETLQGYCDHSGVCRFDRELVEGQPIRVTVGPLAQALGRLVRCDANGRVLVLLEIMGGQIAATLDHSAIAAA